MRWFRMPAVQSDRRILLIVVVLMAVGASLVASSSSYFSEAKFSDAYFLLKRHLARIVIASMFLLLGLYVDYRFYRKLSPVAFVVGVVLLVALLVVGRAVRGTVRWFSLATSFFEIAVQPAELARLTLIAFIAFWIAKKGRDIKELKAGFLPVAGAVVLVLGLLAAQPNYGSAVATAIISALMLYLGGARIRHLAAMALALAAVAGARVLAVGYVRERMLAFFSRGEGLSDMNWQTYQSLVALGSGGFVGTGFGESRQKLAWLPDSHTDFIFAILGEEVGLVGTLGVSLLFLLLALRALKVSRTSSDRFGEMLAVGIGCSIFVYAALNMMVATGLFPVTGLPLPFLSYGGSALVVNAFSIGILLNISKRRWTAFPPSLVRKTG